MCTRRTISRVLLRITVALAWVLVCTDTVAARCVYVHKSDLITLDDSSTNIRALTADAQTFIAFGVGAAGHRAGGKERGEGAIARDIGMTEFRRDPRVCISPACITMQSTLIDAANLTTAKRIKTIAAPRDIVFSRENPSPIDFFFFSTISPRQLWPVCSKCTYTRVLHLFGKVVEGNWNESKIVKLQSLSDSA